MFDAARHKRAMKAYKQYGGKKYVLKSTPHDPRSINDIALLGVDRCYGDSWNRKGLDMKTKALITISMLATLGIEPELKTHIRHAHHQGVTKDQLVDWLIHVNSYIGTPRAVAALRVAREVWAEMAAEKRKKKA
jgi:4-carboxymuconolactone decarboxylase